MKYIHTVLKQNKTTLETWLPYDSRVKFGTKLSLKDVEGVWKVMAISDPTELPESAKHNSKKWHEHDDHRAHKGLNIK